MQVLKVDHNKGEVEVKLVPRVDTNDYSGESSAPSLPRHAILCEMSPGMMMLMHAMRVQAECAKPGICLRRGRIGGTHPRTLRSTPFTLDPEF